MDKGLKSGSQTGRHQVGGSHGIGVEYSQRVRLGGIRTVSSQMKHPFRANVSHHPCKSLFVAKIRYVDSHVALYVPDTPVRVVLSQHEVKLVSIGKEPSSEIISDKP
jgi:hypothetical protein